MTPTRSVLSVGRRRGVAPDSPRGVLLVLQPGTAASRGAVAMLRTLPARAAGVSVIVALKVHGYAFGLPNPGLMPNARERAAAEQAVEDTVRRLRTAGLDVDGQITITRNTAKAVGRIVRRRGATVVIVEQRPAGRLRRLVEGDLSRQISRQVRNRAVVRPLPDPSSCGPS